MFFGILTDSTYSRYSHRFYHLPVLARRVFWYCHGFYLFPAFVRILPFSDTHKDSTFFGTNPDSFSVLARTVFRYSHVFYLFLVIARILPFSGTHPDSVLVLSRILHISGTRTDSTVFRYSQRFYLFWYSLGQFFGTLTDSTCSWHSHGFSPFPVLTKILPFS